jgi:hypothetical protein
VEKQELAPGIVVYKNVIDLDLDFIDEIESAVTLGTLAWAKAEVRSLDSDAVDSKLRDCSTIGIPFMGIADIASPADFFINEISEVFRFFFAPVEQDYMQTYGILFSEHYNFEIVKYEKGQMFSNHIDDHPTFHRRISTIFGFNDNYSGGEVYFPNFNLSYKIGANEMLIFPSTYVYNSSIIEVTEGSKYEVLSWIK